MVYINQHRGKQWIPHDGFQGEGLRTNHEKNSATRYDNYTTVVMLEWIIGVIGAWLTLISLVLGYFYKNCNCKAGPVVDGRRESYRPPTVL